MISWEKIIGEKYQDSEIQNHLSFKFYQEAKGVFSDGKK